MIRRFFAKSRIRFFCFIFILFSFFAGVAVFPVLGPSGVHAADKPPVRSAAEIDYPPFSYLSPDGAATGFSVELMRAALAKMGRDVTFQTGPWPEVRMWLENGDVEALPLVGRTAERESLFDFTFPYMSLYGAIVVRKTDIHDIWDLKDLAGRTVAVMKGDNAEEFLRRQDRDVQIQTTDTFTDAFHLLSNGGCDAVVVQRLVALRLLRETNLTNLVIVNRPIEDFRQDFCFAVPEGDRDTLALLNEGLSLVIADGTYQQLHAKWFAALELPENRRIVIGGDHNFPPFEFLDENGRPAGFNVDLVRAIALETGMAIEFRLGSWANIREDLASGKIDAIQGMFYSPERDKTFDFTPPYIVNHCVAVVRKGRTVPVDVKDLTGLDIVVQTGDIMHDFALKNHLGEPLSTVDAQEEALRELADGRHDCALVSRMTAFYWIEKYGWDHLEVGGHSLRAPAYCLAVPNGQKALLARFSEGLRQIQNSGEYRRIYEKWMGGYQPMTPDLQTILRYAAVILVPLTVLLLGFFVWNRMLRRQVAGRTEALSRSEEQYRLLADNTLDTIWTLDMDLVFTYINPACLAMTGYTPEEWIGSRLQDHCDEANFQIMAENVAKGLDSGPDFPGVIFEAEMIKKNGEPLPVEIHGKVIFNATGQPVMLQGVTRDISERKKLQNQLIHAQKMESIGRLAGGVAHDFNNMLSVILGYAELALDRVFPDDPLHKDIREIESAGRRASEVTRQLLAFARRQTIDPRVLDLNETVESMLRMLRRLIGEDIDLVWHPGPGRWTVHMDPVQVDQVLVNLCVNAKDAIDGVGKITIETDCKSFDAEYCADHAEALGGDFVMLAVTDNGCGMDAETLANIYEPFFTTKGVGKGTGLGLPTVYGIVKQNNGFINVYSEPGAGTSFRLYFPRHMAAPETPKAVKTDEIPKGGGETVLVVEDDETILAMARKMLERLGYQVLTAAGPARAEDLAASHGKTIDLLMTDVIMPEMNGRDLSENLKTRNPNLNVLFMSGYTANVIAHHGVLEDGVVFIQKPFSRKELATKVRQALSE